MDGNWDDFRPVDNPANNLVFGSANWSGPDDLRSSFRLGWDAHYLYVAAKVKDDHYVQNATGGDIYKGDSLEVLFDSNLLGDFYYNQLSPDDYQLGISPGRPDVNGIKEAYMWFPKPLAGSRPSVKISSSSMPDGYRVSCAIPWSVFGVAPDVGRRYGFAFSVSDNDNPAANEQQSMVSNAPGRSLLNPMTWGEMLLSW